MREKRFFTFLLVFLLLATFGTGLVKPVLSSPDVIVVPEDYPTIHEAIDAASPGGTIIVHEGLYAEGNIVVSKPLTLIAEEQVIVDGLNSWDVFRVTSDDVVIRGFIIENAEYGIHLCDVGNCKIEGNAVTSTLEAGILVLGSRNTVSGNVVSNSYDGIAVGGGFNVFKRNTIRNTHHGIYSSVSGPNMFEGNIVNNNFAGFYLWYSHSNVIQENTVTNNSWGGIWVGFSENNNIKENSVTGNQFGIGLFFSQYNIIKENRANDNGDGIGLSVSRHNTLKGNIANRNTQYGMATFFSRSNIMKENKVLHNGEFDLYSDGLGAFNVWTENRYRTRNW